MLAACALILAACCRLYSRSRFTVGSRRINPTAIRTGFTPGSADGSQAWPTTWSNCSEVRQPFRIVVARANERHTVRAVALNCADGLAVCVVERDEVIG